METIQELSSSIQKYIQRLFNKYQQRSIKKNLDFTLTESDFINLIFKKCFYCKCPPYLLIRSDYMKYPIKFNGIDRIDNSKGYTLENSVTCCKYCNRAKNIDSQKNFMNWIKKINKY